MRRFVSLAVVCAVGALAVSVVLVAAESTAEPELVPAVVPIHVRVRCNGEDVGEFTINNQTARLSKRGGDTARFQLLGGSDVTEVTLEPKDGEQWPFADAPPTFGRGNERASGAIREDIEPGSYGYNLLVTCGSTPDVIDPRMDIDP